MKEDQRPHLATLGEKAWAMSLSDDPAKTGQLLADLADDRRRLGGPDPTALESVLAERAALCLMECRMLDVVAGGMERKKASAEARARLDRRRANAERRLVSGLRALARVRRLRPPSQPTTTEPESVTGRNCPAFPMREYDAG